MIRYLLFLLLFLGSALPSISHAQRWQAGIQGALTVRHVIYRHKFPLSQPDEYTELVKERGLPGWDLGGTVLYHFNSRWCLRSSLLFSKKGFVMGPLTFFNNRGEPFGAGNARYNFLFLEVPITIEYTWSPKRKYYALAGISPNWLLDDARNAVTVWGNLGDPQVQSLKEFDGRNLYYRHFNLGLWLGIGKRFSLAEQVNLSIAPTFQLHLLDTNTFDKRYRYYEPERRNFYAVGLQIALTYAFHKKEKPEEDPSTQ
ncbi:outer membrane beta-barrel protein [Catalinimonas alkaloidigena]|uniref:outer membrane beta-barrel protein n=1 Tax=Catalinimonas alkaloidigena TaxID=1075417 RepID=UPI0015A0E382|nr:outer membrane beta-barrel protein [Catalinimonas alkaloidigena]